MMRVLDVRSFAKMRLFLLVLLVVVLAAREKNEDDREVALEDYSFFVLGYLKLALWILYLLPHVAGQKRAA